MRTAAHLSEPLSERARTAPAPALYPAPAADFRVGRAEVFAHHGEIVQGVFYSPDGAVEHGLVTLPCPLFSTRATFRPLRSGPLTAEPGGRTRALAAARLALDALGRTGWGGSLRIDGNVPLRWGCGSSTTDVLSTIRAVCDAFGAALEPAWVAGLAVAAETASDSLMFGPARAVVFAQRRGRVLYDLGGPLPLVRVLGFNTEGGHGVETLALPPVEYTSWEVEAFRPVLGLLRRAVADQDPELLGRVATASTVLMQGHRPKRQLAELLRLARSAGATGVQVAHSGTVAGFLFDPAADAEGRIAAAREGLAGLGVRDSWEFSTEFATQPEAAR